MTGRRSCREHIWYRDLNVLLERWYEFFPRAHQDDAERVNAAVRLMLYVSLAVWLYNRDARYLAVALAGIALASVAFEARTGRRSRRGATCGSRRGASCGSRRRRCRRTRETCGPSPTLPASSQPLTEEPFADPPPAACVRSTPDNPFANFLPADDPGRPPACSYDSMEGEIRANFNRGLFRNAYDVYERENSQRQFTIMPVTTAAADVGAFAEFCYSTPPGRTREDALLGS